MATRESSAPAHPATTRLERGTQLYRDHFQRFSYAGNGTWLVPSSGTDQALAYEVALRDVERCECKDHSFRGSRCAHIIAARIFKAKTGTCASCGERHRHRDMVEVEDSRRRESCSKRQGRKQHDYQATTGARA